MFFLQETLWFQFNANELDQLTDNNSIACFTPATPNTSSNRGRPKSCLTVFCKTSNTINFFPIMFKSRVMGFKVQTMSDSFVLLIVYLSSDESSLFHFMNSSQTCRIFQTLLTTSPLIFFRIGDIDADTFKGRFSIFLKVRC